jgi:hypothetical protein
MAARTTPAPRSFMARDGREKSVKLWSISSLRFRCAKEEEAPAAAAISGTGAGARDDPDRALQRSSSRP